MQVPIEKHGHVSIKMIFIIEKLMLKLGWLMIHSERFAILSGRQIGFAT
jgi:hypothetical protein